MKPLIMQGAALSKNPYFQPLQQAAKQFEARHLTELFLKYPNRFHQLSIQLEELLVDFSKQRLDQTIIDQLQALAVAAGLPEAIRCLFSETKINQSEGRAAMHWALRTPEKTLLEMGVTSTIAREIHQELEKMYALVEKIHQGQYRGATGEVVTDVVNIGVGGSDLGPLMASYALSDFKVTTEKPLNIHFVSTMDGSQLSELLHRLRPETTLFIISSKSFGTIDTLKNAETVRHWLDRHLGLSEAVLQNHFIGVSSNVPAMTKWGIAPDRQLLLWDWVGGRYSLWSCIGLPIALTIGVEEFQNFLAGAHLIDRHFQQAALGENLPALLGLIGVWNSNFLDIQTHAVLPYDGRLKYFASYLQQLEMESNGKEVTRESTKVDYTTCPIIWGEVGPNAQHAFYQLLHQGTQAVSADFIAPIHRYSDAQFTYSESAETLLEQHDLALANCFAQSRLLAFGNDALQEPAEALPLYKQYQGNQPSTTFLLERLTPKTLGMLIALYEHKVFVQSVLWEINPFDQWGVEKGKEIANQLIPMIKGDQKMLNMVDSSTRGLIQSLTTARKHQ